MKKTLFALFSISIFLFTSTTEAFEKESQIQLAKPTLDIEELGLSNFLLNSAESTVTIEGATGNSSTTIFSGNNHNADGSPASGGKPALRLSVADENCNIQDITLEGTPTVTEGNYDYTINTDLLFPFLRKNADIEITTDTVYENTVIGSENDYQIVYVNNAKLTLSENFTGYGIIYVEDEDFSENNPLIEMLVNAKWYGLIIVNQTNDDKTSRLFFNGTPTSSGAGDYVFLASNNITIGTNLEITSGNIGVTAEGGSLIIGDNAELADSLTADNISIGNNAQIGGDITYNNLSHGNNFELDGDEITPLSFPYLTLPDFPSFSAGSENINKGNNQTYYLDSGSYGNISFGNNGILYLNGGEYYINNLTMGNNSYIRYLAPSTVMVKQKITAGNNTVVETQTPGLDGSDCIFYIQGYGYSAATNVFSLGNNPQLRCNIYAPNSTVNINENLIFKGAIIAKNITTDNNCIAEIELESAFPSSSASYVQVYGSLIFVGDEFYLPNEGKNVKLYYCEEAIENAIDEISTRPAIIQKWKESE